jgi:hypothetical protein
LLQELTKAIGPAELRDRVYDGEILCFRQLPAIVEFCTVAREIAGRIDDSKDPTYSYQPERHAEWLESVYRYQLAASSNEQYDHYFAQAMQWAGLRPAQTFRDRFIFRVVPPENLKSRGRHSNVDIHRDSWGAGIFQQINWWGPVFDYAPDSGIQFYPDYFDRPIANNTATWSYQNYVKARQVKTAELKPDYQSVPGLLENPVGEAYSPQLDPGDLLCFSAAHLHGSNLNQSDRSRFSFETRTVNLDDIQSGKAAVNVDNASTGQMLNLFHNMVDKMPLTSSHFTFQR